jgi:hypothetical protein
MCDAVASTEPLQSFFVKSQSKYLCNHYHNVQGERPYFSHIFCKADPDPELYMLQICILSEPFLTTNT